MDPAERVTFLVVDGDEPPHDDNTITPCLFVEMDKLDPNAHSWSEVARWLKFEEDVEEGGRWSKPHVATITLHSLVELRTFLTKCVVMLDIEGETLETVFDVLLDTFVIEKTLTEETRDLCKNILQMKHIHQFDKQSLKLGREDTCKQIPFVQSFVDLRNKASKSNGNGNKDKLDHAIGGPVIGKSSTQTEIHESKHRSSIFSMLKHCDTTETHLKINTHFMKKLPPNSEVANVMIGGVDFLSTPLCAFVRLANARTFGDLSEVSLPTKFIFVLLGPKGEAHRYYEVGRSMCTLLSDEIYQEISYKARNRQHLIAGIDDFMNHVLILPPGEWDPAVRIDPPTHIPEKEERMNNFPMTMPKTELPAHEEDPLLKKSGRFCGGLINDIKRVMPFYPSDFYDALSFQCVATIIFMYFACLSPIVTFGGLLGKATHDNMGAIESLVSAAVCGTLYHLFAGQPLTILGSTGPVLVFESIVDSYCASKNMDYLGFRVWIGIWTAGILLVTVATDGCALIRHITRFTEESFAALIGLIFIWEAFHKMAEIFHFYPFKLRTRLNSANVSNYSCLATNMTSDMPSQVCLNASDTTPLSYGPNKVYYPDIFLFSVILFSLTFILIYLLKNFASANYFPSIVRSKISDFAVVTVITLTVLLDALVGIDTPKLHVPSTFDNTLSGRGWFVSPFGRIKWYYCILASVPALLNTILIFMDQNITSVIINRKENKLKKGGGYHLDMLIVAVCILINSLFGLPWFVAATVLSVNHVISLRIESQCTVPGEKPKFIGVREQRVTGLVVYMLIGLSVFLTSFLKYIPMPVLYGIFLYMGVSSLSEIQFWNRITLMFMPEKYQPDYVFLRHVQTRRVHLFTIIQLVCMILLWLVKSIEKISICFPLMVLTLTAVRKVLPYIFTSRELAYLDDIKPEYKKKAEEDATLIEDEKLFQVKVPKKRRFNPTDSFKKRKLSLSLCV